MPSFLPPNLLALFAPRPPLDFRRPADTLPWEKGREEDPSKNYSGLAGFLDRFEKSEDQPLPIREETRTERAERIKKSRLETHKRSMQEELMTWDPSKNKNATLDAYKTLFVARLDYSTGSDKLRREFEQYGRVSDVTVVKDKVTGKSQGYAFIEFDSEKDIGWDVMKNFSINMFRIIDDFGITPLHHTLSPTRHAYKYADGSKIDGRKILVDVERGRTVQGWRPRRFGGGLGSTRKAKEKKKHIKKEPAEQISLHDGPQYHNAAFDQMRRFGTDREKKQNYGGFGVDRNKDKGTGKYNPGYEIWDQGRQHQRRNFDRDGGDRNGGGRGFDSGRDRRREADGGRDDDVIKKVKRERRDKYEGYGDGRREDQGSRPSFKREYHERPSNDNDTHRQRGYNSEKRKKYYRD